MIVRFYISAIVLLMSHLVSFGQDTSQIFSYKEFLQLVAENHPWMKKVENIEQRGEAVRLASKGGFDPVLNGSINQKYFSGTKYYSYLNGGLSIPTWFGVKATTGYDQNIGEYISLSSRTPAAGLWYAGVEVNLGNGLLMDERRATWKKGQLFESYSIEEAKVKRNEVLYQASVAYWNWFATYHSMKKMADVVATSQLRFDNLKMNAQLGEVAAIDTVEAKIQLNNRSITYEKMQYEYFLAQQHLNTFLWLDGFIPLELNQMEPESLNELQQLETKVRLVDVEEVIAQHPYLKMNQLKVDQLQVDLRLKQEYLKPKLALKYNALSEPIGGNVLEEYSINNYTWGATFAYPILTRQERGNVQLQKTKLSDQKLDLLMNERTLERDIRSSQEKAIRYYNQSVSYLEIVDNYERLYVGELQLFEAGESNLFMVNAREVYYLDGMIGLISTISDYHIANASYLKTIVRLDELVN